MKTNQPIPKIVVRDVEFGIDLTIKNFPCIDNLRECICAPEPEPIPDFVVGDVVFIGKTEEVGMITKITPQNRVVIAELYLPGNHPCYIEILTDSIVLRDYSPLRKIFGQRL
jgi:hypothetical protein